jgi:hypothetical protein
MQTLTLCSNLEVPNHVTGSGRSTRHSRRVITLRPGALLEISFLFLNSSTPTKSIHYFCDWERRYSQVRFPAIQYLQVVWLYVCKLKVTVVKLSGQTLISVA